MKTASLRALLVLAALPILAACENSATAFMVDSKDHALILVREQKLFWSNEVRQAVIASRMPQCQKRVSIHPGVRPLVDMHVYEAGHRLWALQQGERWYLASTEACRVQDWVGPDGDVLGAYVGRFMVRDGKPVFVAESDRD